MKRKHTTLFATMLLMLFAISFTACDAPDTHKHADDSVYTCPMHPTVVQNKPGKCPICSMDLVKTTPKEPEKNTLMLSDTQMRLANITTGLASMKPFGESVVLNGRIAANKDRSEVISSRAPGRIERLTIRETGTIVKAGAPLYSLYSEQLLTLQQEYLLAREQWRKLGDSEARYKSFLDAAERKLILYGLTKAQVAAIDEKSAQSPVVTFVAPVSGVVTTVDVTEGQYVAEGQALFSIEDLSTVWVEAELYAGEQSKVKTGDRMVVNTGNSRPAEAVVAFINPEFQSNAQVLVMRAEVENKDNSLRPGQQVTVTITDQAKDALTLPVEAVIRNATGAHVYVQKGRNTFQARMVETGVENVDEIEIIKGITKSDTVALSGAYLLYSEMVLKKGSDPMAGHQH